MKKKLYMTSIVLLGFVSTPVFAAGNDCGIFSDYLNKARNIMFIAAPILLFLMGTIDFLGAVTASDEKAIKKATSKFIKRLIVCVVILILPTLINLVIGWTTLNNLTACL